MEFLAKIRKLNWVLSESTTGNLSYEDLSTILRDIIGANIYIIDQKGRVLAVAYEDASDTSTYQDEFGVEKVTQADNAVLLSMTETTANLFGEEVESSFGPEYRMTDKYHTIVPSTCGGKRLGTLLVTRYNKKLDDEELALCEYGATVIGLEIQRNIQNENTKKLAMRLACDMALDTMSYSEKDALQRVLQEFPEDEGIIVASKVASKYGLTNSVIVNALRKLESAGLIDVKSLGMKGTHIEIINPYLREKVI